MRAARGKYRLPRDCGFLDRQPLITFPDNGSIFRKRLELLLSSRSVSYVDRLTEQNSLGAMIAGISAGIGFGYLPHSIVSQYVESGIMCEFPFDDPYSNLQIEFIYRKDHVMDGGGMVKSYSQISQEEAKQMMGRRF